MLSRMNIVRSQPNEHSKEYHCRPNSLAVRPSFKVSENREVKHGNQSVRTNV